MRPLGRGRVPLALMLGLATASVIEADTYLNLVQDYQRGHFARATRELLELSEEDVRRAGRGVRERPDLVRLARAATMLHAEAAFRSPELEAFHLDQAEAYVELRDPHPSAPRFERDWNLLVAYFYIGQLRDEWASPYLERARELDRTAVEPRLARGVAYALGGWLGADEDKLERAREVLEELSGPEAEIRLAHVLVLEGESRRARELLERNLARPTSPLLSAVAHCLLGRIQTERGELEEAVASYRAAMAREERFQNAAVGLGRALEKTGRRDEARGDLSEFLTGAGGSERLDAWWRFVLGEAARFPSVLRRMREKASW